MATIATISIDLNKLDKSKIIKVKTVQSIIILILTKRPNRPIR
jgi:hypothetical protein